MLSYDVIVILVWCVIILRISAKHDVIERNRVVAKTKQLDLWCYSVVLQCVVLQFWCYNQFAIIIDTIAGILQCGVTVRCYSMVLQCGVTSTVRYASVTVRCYGMVLQYGVQLC
jgi:hypothetical protein